MKRPPFVDAPFSPGRVMAGIGGSLEPVRPDEIEIRIGGTTVLVEGAVVDPLRADPRFAEFLRRVGFEPDAALSTTP